MNRRPRPYQGRALPTELQGHNPTAQATIDAHPYQKVNLYFSITAPFKYFTATHNIFVQKFAKKLYIKSIPIKIITMFYSTPETAIGQIKIIANEHCVIKLEFVVHFKTNSNHIVDIAFSQLTEYLSENRKKFDLPLCASGTDFQRRTWNELMLIPYGETRNYKTVAQNIGNSKASRAVGNANNKNPIPIFIPCHRVVGANGSLVGYVGGIAIKEKLLKIERQNINQWPKL